MNPKELADLRKDYRSETLDVSEVKTDPLEQFKHWFNEAMSAEIIEPNAMTLATANQEGVPSARIVLLKGIEEGTFVFYTNYNSQKGQDLAENPKAALVFSWLELERQIRIEGRVEKVSPETSTAYFQSRPKGSQIGAWTSPQSDVIIDRKTLEERYEDLVKKYENDEILPRPEHWGGYAVIPTKIEFWQGRTSRLHDRICYTKQGAHWKIERLAP